MKNAKTLGGDDVSISVEDGKVAINNANVVKTDIRCSNGIVHVIDSVLLPPEKKKVSAADGRRMIEHAVSRGVKLYNAGHHAACAKIYMEVAREMDKLRRSNAATRRVESKLRSYIRSEGNTARRLKPGRCAMGWTAPMLPCVPSRTTNHSEFSQGRRSPVSSR